MEVPGLVALAEHHRAGAEHAELRLREQILDRLLRQGGEQRVRRACVQIARRWYRSSIVSLNAWASFIRRKTVALGNSSTVAGRTHVIV